jgi:ABC-type multidrug transport system ATPase subunit
MKPTLTATHIQKSYGNFQALADASLEIAPGEILALLGPNGAGKTTLIKILATLLTRDAGSVEIMGYDLDQHTEEIRHQVGYIGQDTERSAYARLTVWENLEFFGTLRGLSQKQIRSQVDALVDYFDFQDQLDKQFITLSGGQKQTVVIIRGLLHNPPLVFLDEPTKGLDPIIARRIRNYLRKYVHDQGKSMLLTSHVLSEVDDLADRVALIHRGRIHITGTPLQLKAELGAPEFIELQTDPLSPEVIQILLRLPVVNCRLEREEGWLSLGVTDMMAGAEMIIQTLRSTGIQSSFRHHTASLEDAFLYHVGKIDEHFDA